MFDKKKEFNKAAREGRESLNEFFKKIKKLESLEKKKSGGSIKGKPYGMKQGGISKNKKSMNDQFFDAIDRRRAKKIFDVRKRIDERVEKQRLEGLRERGVKHLPRLGSKGAEEKFGRVRVVTPDDIDEAKYIKEKIKKDDEAFEKAGFVNTINLKKGGLIKGFPKLAKKGF